jgi:hypothetical protein
MRARHRRWLAPVVAVLFALTPATRIYASAPTRIVQKVVNDQFTFAACDGLSVTRTLNGTIQITDFVDKNGELREAVHVRLKGSFTNDATGVSIPFVVAETDVVNLNPDGSATVAIIGLVGMITVPGLGLVTADVGRLVLSFTGPQDPNPQLLLEAGRHDNGPFPYICSVLEGTN